MNSEQSAAETRYQLARCIFLRLHTDGAISSAELNELLAEVAAKYGSLIGELEVNSIATEDGYKDLFSI